MEPTKDPGYELQHVEVERERLNKRIRELNEEIDYANSKNSQLRHDMQRYEKLGKDLKDNQSRLKLSLEEVGSERKHKHKFGSKTGLKSITKQK